MMAECEKTPCAGLLLIGDEILSGRTEDKNLAVIARFLGKRGIDLCEVRVVADVEDEIIAALNALRERYTYVFTTGGIGPTHDDITADAVARAFGVKLVRHPRAVEKLLALFAENGVEPNEERMRMARVPEGATLIESEKVKAPGFHIGNVFVMAGVPWIMKNMLEALAPELETGEVVQSRSVRFEVGEGDIAGPLKAIQARYKNVSIGSYPFVEDGVYGSNVVVRSRDKAALERALEEVEVLRARLHKEKGRGAHIV